MRCAELASMTASGGTTAVIAPAALFDHLSRFLARSLGETLGVGVAGLSRPVALLTPADAKGLEFDSVLVVSPAGLVAESTRGASALYVAMTRPTQRLTLLLAPGEQPPAAL